MRLRPGRNLVKALIGLTLLSTFSIAASAIVYLSLAMLITCLIAFYLSGRRLKTLSTSLTIERLTPNVAGRDTEITISLLLKNSGGAPLLGVLRDDVPGEGIPQQVNLEFSVPANQSLELEYNIRIPVRGKFTLSKIWVELEDRFSFSAIQYSIDELNHIKVLPEIFSSEAGLEQSLSASVQLLDKLKVARQSGVGTEFESLSEFREGDDERRLDWRATARLDYPVIRRFQIERHRDVMILVDCGRLMGQQCDSGTKLDFAVDAGLMLARVALNGGDRCGIGLFDNKVLGFVPPQSSSKSIQLLTECVYNAKSELKETNFSSMFGTMQMRQKMRSLVIVLSDIVDNETSARFRNSLSSLARQHLVLFVAVKTPLLQQLVKKQSENLQNGFEKLVALQLMQERVAALRSISQTGVNVLDVEPTELTVPLINYFIELRQSNSL